MEAQKALLRFPEELRVGAADEEGAVEVEPEVDGKVHGPLAAGEVHANGEGEDKVDEFEAADVEIGTSVANCRASTAKPAVPRPSRGEASPSAPRRRSRTRPEEEHGEGEEEGITATEALPNRPQQHSDAKKSAMPPSTREAPATAQPET